MKYNPDFTHWCQEQHFDYIKSNINSKKYYAIHLVNTYRKRMQDSPNVFQGSETDASTSDEEEKDPVMRKKRMKAVCEY